MNRESIQRRAQQIGKISQNQLLYENEENECTTNAFKWAYLILYRPKRYLQNFKEGDLRIDPQLLEEFIWQFQDEIDPPNGLTLEERALLDEHNREAMAYIRDTSKVISLVRPNFSHQR